MAVIKSALNGGTAEVDDEYALSLIESGQWIAVGEAPVAPPALVAVTDVATPETPAETPTEAPVKRRIRRTQAQIAADNAAAAAAKEAAKTEE